MTGETKRAQAICAERGEAMNDTVAKIIAFEEGDLDDAAIIDLFQELIDSGLAWQLQGVYGRTASALIDEGWCHWPEKKEE